MRITKLLLIVAATSLPGCGGSGSYFDEPFWQDTDVLVADVDGDGRADILTLGSWVQHGDHLLGRIGVYRQVGPGVFAEPETAAADVYPWRIALGDLDGDRFLDVVITYPTDRQIAVMRQNPDRPGAFLPEQRITLPGAAYGAAIADLNGDGRGDIAAGNNAPGGGIFLLLQDPVVTAQFGPPMLVAAGRSVEFVVAGDLDGDLRADLAFGASIRDPGTQAVETWVGLLFQQQGGTLAAPAYVAPVTDRYVKGLHLVDFDGDGGLDLIAVYSAPPAGGDSRISVFLQGAPGDGLDAPIDTSASASFVTSFVADLDGDGRPDVGLARWPASPGIDRFLNSGAGAGAPLTFAGTTAVTNGSFHGHAAGGRLDGDLLDDMAAAFAGFAFLAHQQAPGVFGPFVQLTW